MSEEEPKSRLTTRITWLFGSGELGVSVSHVLQGLFFTTFLLEVSKVQPSMAGTIILVGQIWDALTTPIIGYLSDNVTRTRWGRRKPWLLAAALPFSLSFLGLWQAWPDSESGYVVAYYIIIVMMFNLSGNAIQIPYSALTTDLIETYKDSIILTRARMALDMIGGVLASLAMSALITSFYYPNGYRNYIRGYRIFSIIGAVLFLIPPILIFLFISEKPLPPKRKKDADEKTLHPCRRIWSAFVKVLGILKFKPYLILTIVYLLCWSTIQFSQSNLFLFYKHVIKIEQHFQWILFTIQLVGAVSLFLWSALGEWLDKKLIYTFGMIIMALTFTVSFWMDDQWPVWSIYISAVPAGLGLSTAFLIPWSMVPDIINAYEYKYGERKEGVFYSIFVLIQKIGTAIALAMHSYSLGWAGFQGSGTQSDYVLKIIRIMASWVPFTSMSLAIIIIQFFPLGLFKMRRIMTELSRSHATMEED